MFRDSGENACFLRAVQGARGIVGFREALDPPSADRSGKPISRLPNQRKYCRREKRGALDLPFLLLFCFVLGHLINHFLLACLITNVKVLSTHMNYGSGNYTKTDRNKQ